MRHLFLLMTLVPSFLAAQVVNVRQSTENSRIIVTFDLSGDPDDRFDIRLTAVNETGALIMPTAIVGDIADVIPGILKSIWWEPQLEGFTASGWKVSLTANKHFVPGSRITDGVINITFENGWATFTIGSTQNFLPSTKSSPGDIGVSTPMTITAPSGYLLYFNEQPGWVTSFQIPSRDFQGIPTIWQKNIILKCISGGTGNVNVSVIDRNGLPRSVQIPVRSH